MLVCMYNLHSQSAGWSHTCLHTCLSHACSHVALVRLYNRFKSLLPPSLLLFPTGLTKFVSRSETWLLKAQRSSLGVADDHKGRRGGRWNLLITITLLFLAVITVTLVLTDQDDAVGYYVVVIRRHVCLFAITASPNCLNRQPFITPM